MKDSIENSNNLELNPNVFPEILPEILKPIPNILEEKQTETQEFQIKSEIKSEEFQEFCMLYLNFPTKTQLLLWELDKLAGSLDWYYEYSDDHSVWKAGEAKQSAILALKKNLVEHGEEAQTAAQKIIWKYSLK